VTDPREELEIELTVNGERTAQRVPARRLLVDLLRDDLELTGTHIGCEQGICGACTVLIDGMPARSCITLAVQVDGAEVVTIEGITPANGLSPMQDAFKQRHGLQCGFCTPGFLVTLSAADPADHPDDESIRELISGNLCRCTGYQQIVDAVRLAWDREEGDP
jgi:aerobic-type carbon monoxide dehydrogenase small subunit (CoxS/CutS family)